MKYITKIFCPFCKKLENLVSCQGKKKLLGCGCFVKFKKTRSQKDMDRKYVMTAWGMELVK